MKISSRIRKIFEEIFDSEEQKAIQRIIQAFSQPGNKRKVARLIMRGMVPLRPKRPLYYLNYEVKFFPMRTRYVVEQSGSYLDLLVKELRYEKQGQYRKTPLGRNIDALFEKSDDDLKLLLRQLKLFNEIAYVPSKHEYGPPYENKHFFNSLEAVIIVLAAIKLGEELKAKSVYIKKLCQDLVLPGQGMIYGDWKREDSYGEPFDFKKRLLKLTDGVES
jgi:hypothetical protein